MTSSTRTASVVLQALLVVVFLVNVAMNVRQRRELERLGNTVQELRQSLASRRLLRGDPLAEVEVLDRDGRAHVLNARDGKARLMLVVDPRCDSCTAKVQELVQLRPNVPAWVISLADVQTTNRFADEHHLQAVSLSPRNYPLLRQKLAGYPQIVRLDGAGLVARTCATVRECV